MEKRVPRAGRAAGPPARCALARRALARCAAALALLCGCCLAASAAPVILTEPTSTRAVAVDALTLLRDPFAVNSNGFVGGDRRARVMLFVLGLELLAGEGANALSADAEDSAGRRYELPVESVSNVRGFEGVRQVVVLLRPEMENVGDVLVRINLHGVSSNRVRISIGRATATPADDPGSAPHPAPAAPPLAPQPPLTPPSYGPGAVSEADAVRFLEQATWGATAAEVARVRQMGLRAWLEEQFNTPTSHPASYTLVPTDLSLGCPNFTGSNAAACTREHYSPMPLQINFFRDAMYERDQLRQRVAFALHQIFVVSFIDLPITSWIGYYLQTLDRNAFGNYRTLLGEVTLNPAMGEYLNMRGNTRFNPNENFAREVLQLFSTGVDELNPDGTPRLDAQGNRVQVYDQEDINNFARVFTGWNLAAPKTFTTFFGSQVEVFNFQDPMIVTNANNHDTGAKTLLRGSTIQPFAGGTTQQRVDYANSSLGAALDNIAGHPNVGPFVGKQLIQHLVTSNPSPAYVERVARAFNNDCDALYPEACANRRGDLKAVVRAVLLDPEARGDLKTDPKYGRLREPVQHINNVLRAWGAHSFANPAAESDGILAEFSSTDLPRSLDQRLFYPPTVFGYYSPLYEVPGTGVLGPAFEILSTTTALRRANAVNLLVFTGITQNAAIRPQGTALNLTPLEQQAANPAQLVEGLNSLLMHGTMTSGMKSQLVSAVSSIPSNDPQSATKRARTAAYLVLSSAQFQVQR
jgi:uncharacterized protein (DUF1800 family)